MFRSHQHLFQLYDFTPLQTVLSSRKINSQTKTIEKKVDATEIEIYLCDNCDAQLHSKDAYDVSK